MIILQKKNGIKIINFGGDKIRRSSIKKNYCLTCTYTTAKYLSDEIMQ